MRKSALLPVLSLLALVSCDWTIRTNISDYLAPGEPPPPPAASLPPGMYTGTQTVTLSKSPSASGDILYTTASGAVPPLADWVPYASSIPIDRNTTLRACVYKSALSFSDIATFGYSLKTPAPTLSPPPSTTPATLVTVTLNPPSSIPSGATVALYYTLDGSNPALASNPNRKPYTAPFDIDLFPKPMSVLAVAVLDGWSPSDVVGGDYYSTTTPGTADLGFDVWLPGSADPVANPPSATIPVGTTMQVMATNPAGVIIVMWDWYLTTPWGVRQIPVWTPSAQNLRRFGADGPWNDPLAYTSPATPMAPGYYTVSVEAVDDHGFHYSKNFAFTVTP